MLEAAITAWQNLMDLERMGFLVAGVLMGLSLGAIPGLGGLVGLAILLPFTFNMDQYAAFAMMIGLTAVVSSSDTIPSVLFAVPGSVASQATILDGHPMAKKGEAGRAFGAAYMASLIGGLFGAFVLTLSIPILRPLVLAFGAPEFFMLAMLGLSMVASLSGQAPIKGILAAAMGLWFGVIGMNPQSSELRWTFDLVYLLDGIPLVPVGLGIFAIPEIIDLTIKGTRISDVPKGAITGVRQGIRDVFQNWFLVLRCSALGVWIGFLPGLGGAVVDWFAYGHAIQTEKGAKETFGKGDVRGVIAPESANNAKEGGALIPTVAFGVPGSISMALLLGAFMIHGLTPGPDMLTIHLDVTFTLIWSLALANIFGTALLLLFTNQLAKLATVRIHVLAPMVIVVVFLAVFQSSGTLGDIVALLFFTTLGWFMKRFGWPRPPVVLGFVLSPIVENNLYIAMRRYGLGWFSHPIVLVIGAILVLTMVYNLGFLKRKERPEGGQTFDDI